MIHELKTWPKYFARIFTGEKTFEVRKADRDFQINDLLKLLEWDPDTQEFTGNILLVRVTYVLPGGQFGIYGDYVVMSIKVAS